MLNSTKKKSKANKSGKWKEFNKHAILVSEGYYLNSRKHGLWREYYDHTGTIMIEEIYSFGIKNGFYRSFHPNGQVWSEGEFINGLREGYFRVYDEQGNNVRNMLFINNNQIEDIEVPKTLNETAGKTRD
jgi:antitoxin component YwqK of YwqJK toxin-antitoxin module